MTDRTGFSLALLLVCGVACLPARAGDAAVQVSVDPASLRLTGPNASYSLLVHGKTAEGRLVDLTHAARFQALDPKVAAVTEAGVVRSVADGSGTVVVEAAGKSLRIPVQVEGSTRPRTFHFENDIIPMLSKFGCNSSGCHGKAEGQNGFKLSVFGFDPPADFTALTKEARGRRVFPAAPDHSLLLQKISGVVPHGGGVRIRRGTGEYETLRA